MFVSVKNLTALIDQDIQFYIDGVASKEQHSPGDKKEAAPVFSGGFFSCILAK